MRALLARFWWRRYARRNARDWSELESFAKLPPDEQRRQLARRLLDQVRYFGSRADALPEWIEASRIRDPDDLWRVWQELPILSREDLRQRFPADELARRFGIPGRVNSTGGSTGEPTRFFHDTAMLAAIEGAEIWSRLRMGWRPGMATIVVWGAERDIGRSLSLRARLHHLLVRDLLVAGYSLSAETVAEVRRAIRRHSPVAMYGFSSMLEYVAREVAKAGPVEPGSVAVAWCGGEMLYETQREAFRAAFGVDIRNRYGGRELGVIACQHVLGEPLEVYRPWSMVEIVDDRGRILPPGETGRVIVTSTICRGTPFLRYDVGDLATADQASYTEAGVGALAELQGRTADVISLPDGRAINNIFWNHLFKEFPEVRQFQVILRRDGRLAIQLLGSGFVPERERHCRDVLQRFLGEVPFDLRWVDAISPSPSGKLRQVIVE